MQISVTEIESYANGLDITALQSLISSLQKIKNSKEKSQSDVEINHDNSDFCEFLIETINYYQNTEENITILLNLHDSFYKLTNENVYDQSQIRLRTSDSNIKFIKFNEIKDFLKALLVFEEFYKLVFSTICIQISEIFSSKDSDVYIKKLFVKLKGENISVSFDKLEKFLEENRATLDKLLSLRNKFYSHRDIKFLIKSPNFLVDKSLLVDDIKKIKNMLISAFSEILIVARDCLEADSQSVLYLKHITGEIPSHDPSPPLNIEDIIQLIGEAHEFQQVSIQNSPQ